jgi:hydrogenase expression/formation protein HypC
MCLAIPALITSIEGTAARAEIGGVERTVSLALTPEAQVGDYVLMHTGYAIGVLDAEEAQETLRLFEELAEFYPEETEPSQSTDLPVS